MLQYTYAYACHDTTAVRSNEMIWYEEQQLHENNVTRQKHFYFSSKPDSLWLLVYRMNVPSCMEIYRQCVRIYHGATIHG